MTNNILGFFKKNYLDIGVVLFIPYLLHFFVVNRNYYIQGQWLLDILLVLLILTLWFKKDVIRLSFDWYVIISLVLFVAFLSVNSSERYLHSSIKTGVDLTIIATCILIYLNFKPQIKKNAALILIGILFIFVVFIAPVSMGQMFVPTETDPSKLRLNFFSTLFGNMRVFSYHAFIGCAISFILFRYYSNHVLKVIFGLICFISLVSLILAAGRASVIAILCFSFLSTYVLTRSISRSLLASILLLAVMLVICFILFFTPYEISAKMLLSRFLRALNMFDGNFVSGLNSFSANRIEIWYESLKYTLNSPVYGFGASSYLWSPLPRAGKLIHSHNSVIQISLEYGFLGAFIFIYAFIKFIKPFFYFDEVHDDKEVLRLLVLAFILSFIIFSFFDGLLFHTLTIFQFSLSLMFLCALSNRNSFQK